MSVSDGYNFYFNGAGVVWLNIVLADPVVRRIEAALEESGVDMVVEDWVEMVVRDALGRLELSDAGALSGEDEEKVKERLKDLGYVD